MLIGLGFAVIFATIIASFHQQNDQVEILGQALFVPVLFASLHYGRRAGFISALLAALIFIVAKFNSDSIQMSTFLPEYILARAAIYGLVGIIGGEIASRMKYILIKFEDSALIDKQTNLYSQTYTIKVIERNVQKYQRYFRSFSIAIVELQHSKFDVFNWSLRKKMILRTASAIRDNVRIVDEVGRWNECSFYIIMPDTMTADAKTAVNRVQNLVLKQLGETKTFKDNDLHLETKVLTYPDDREEISGLISPEMIPEVQEGATLGINLDQVET